MREISRRIAHEGYHKYVKDKSRNDQASAEQERPAPDNAREPERFEIGSPAPSAAPSDATQHDISDT